jgi:hypothetical protein
MPPKIDPYATPRARFFDLALILFAMLVVAIVIYTSPRHRSASGSGNHPAAHLSVNLASNTAQLKADN